MIPTLREAPAEATTPSHQLLLRAGYIRQLTAGVYDYLPLAWRSLQKISQIVREEMDAAGASEMLMPALVPVELLDKTGRAEDYGDDLFHFADRHGRPTALAPTHEEVITDFLIGSITSYRQLPLSLYQIQTKFRDEPRPRAGLLRCREFIMKDAYSFHLTVEGEGGLNETYDRMYQAYCNVFDRCGLDYTVVEAESGPIGGSASHEFMVNCETGEDTILWCPASGYAANVEKCEIGDRSWSFDGDTSAQSELVHTPDLKDIESVAEALGIQASDMLKVVIFQPTRIESQDAEHDTPDWIVAVVRGDHEVNEGKVRDAAGCKVVMADQKQAQDAGFAVGFVSPAAVHSVKGKVLLLVDPDAAQGSKSWAAGADRIDYHQRGFNWRSALGDTLDDQRYVKVADIRNAIEGDPSPRAAGEKLVVKRGLETGHIFKLGTKYSDAMGFSVLDETQKRKSVIMGCYGIGVSRTLAACVEMSHDEAGIVWPAAIAPYHVQIVLMKHNNEEHLSTAKTLADSLSQAGLDVLIDDRKERPGVKFKDADLIGMPIRLTIGDRALEQGGVEAKRRHDDGKGEIIALDRIVPWCLDAL